MHSKLELFRLETAHDCWQSFTPYFLFLQCLQHVSATFPHAEEVAVVISCLEDPLVKLPYAWMISVCNRGDNTARVLYDSVQPSSEKTSTQQQQQLQGSSPTATDVKDSKAIRKPEFAATDQSSYRAVKKSFVSNLSQVLMELDSNRPTLRSRSLPVILKLTNCCCFDRSDLGVPVFL